MEVFSQKMSLLGLFAFVVAASAWTRAARAEDAGAKAATSSDEMAEEIIFAAPDRQKTVEGRVVVEAADGGILVEADDGVLWTIERGEQISRRQLDRPFKPLSREAFEARLLAQLPPGFRIHSTPHYVVCYNTSRAYAQWTSSLLERLYKAFTNYWEKQGLAVREPEFPLPVLVFADRQSYDAASREDLPGGTGSIIGFYSLRSNRINMFDLTGAEALRGALNGGARRGSMREINQMLSQPAAEPLVATIVHEATHQISFNCGLMQRYADLPLWLCEGMAVYFEAPDLSSTRGGWSGIGKVNHSRLTTFQENLGSWNDASLEILVCSDRRFRDPSQAVDAYADAWALNYYLIKFRSDKYANYLKALGEKRPLIKQTAQSRLEEFERHFGKLEKLEREFLKQMSRVR